MTPEEFQSLLKPDDIRGQYTLQDADRLVRAVAGLKEGERKKLAKIAAQFFREAAPFSQREFASVAVLATCPLSQARVVRGFLESFEPAALQVLVDRRPAWIDDWVASKLAGQWWEIRWTFLRSLIREGVCEKPRSEGYIRLLAHSLPHAGEQSVSEWLLAEPDVLEDVWQFFQVDIGAFFEHSRWIAVFQVLADQGRLDRQRLLDASLRSLDNGFADASLKGYLNLFQTLKPTPAERAARQKRFLELLSHRASSVVAFALGQLEQLEQEHALDAEAFLASARSVFALKAKAQPKTALSLAAKIAKSRPELVPSAINFAVQALSHDSSEVQERGVALLEKWLPRAHPNHAVVIRERLSGASPTLRDRLQAIVSQLGGELPERQTEAPAAPDDFLAGFIQAASSIDGRWRAAAGIDEAIEAFRQNRLPPALTFEMTEVPVLTGLAPIVPIATADELLDAVAHAVEEIDSADELERILDGISRLCGERPADFEHRAAPLAQRLEAAKPQSNGGLAFFACALPELRELLLRWLTGTAVAGHQTPLRPFDVALMGWPDYAIHAFIRLRISEMVERLKQGHSAALLSAPTNAGGWIDPLAFVHRLNEVQSQGDRPETCDVIQALLRLAPDGRIATLQEARKLDGFLGRIVPWTLGGENLLLDGEDSTAIWLAAGRARYPRENLEMLAGILSDDNQPDSIRAAQYTWQASRSSQVWMPSGAVDVHVHVSPPLNSPLLEILRPTVALHEIERLNFYAAWYYQWLRSIWPLNGDPVLVPGVSALSNRVNAPASTLEPNYVILEALLEVDRPWTELAYLTLWIALVSKDPDSRGAGLDALVGGIEDGRADAARMVDVLARLMQGDWVKLNRVAAALRETARVSPLHAWFAAEVLQGFVAQTREWPTELHHLLELLLELLADLQRPLSTAAREPLAAASLTGKAGKMVRALLALDFAEQSPKATAALHQACSARLVRGRRW